jgi:hypothetical protein
VCYYRGRKQYPEGENFVVANDVDRQYAKSYANIKVTFVNLAGLVKKLSKQLCENKKHGRIDCEGR